MTTTRAKKKYEGLVLDPDGASRNRLKQVCQSVVTFGRITTAGSITQALKELATPDTSTDVIFVSHRLDQEAIRGFITDCKNSVEGEDSTYIMVLPTGDNSKTQMAQALMLGADGVLFEPYSVDLLVEITELSDRIRRERSGSREKSAIELLLKDLIKQLDAIAFLKSNGSELGPIMKNFRASCATLANLEGPARLMYFELAIEAFEKAPVMSAMMKGAKYEGVSLRVKKRLADLVKTRIEREFLENTN